MIHESVLPKIKTGAKIKVFEGKTPFEGLVIATKHGKENGGSFTVRTILAGVGVERIFPIHSPSIIKVEVVSTPKKVGKSKLYYVRDISAKKLQQKLKVSL
jgi:large subunit ribosomal protein L19